MKYCRYCALAIPMAFVFCIYPLLTIAATLSSPRILSLYRTPVLVIPYNSGMIIGTTSVGNAPNNISRTNIDNLALYDNKFVYFTTGYDSFLPYAAVESKNTQNEIANTSWTAKNYASIYFNTQKPKELNAKVLKGLSDSLLKATREFLQKNPELLDEYRGGTIFEFGAYEYVAKEHKLKCISFKVAINSQKEAIIIEPKLFALSDDMRMDLITYGDAGYIKTNVVSGEGQARLKPFAADFIKRKPLIREISENSAIAVAQNLLITTCMTDQRIKPPIPIQSPIYVYKFNGNTLADAMQEVP